MVAEVYEFKSAVHSPSAQVCILDRLCYYLAGMHLASDHGVQEVIAIEGHSMRFDQILFS